MKLPSFLPAALAFAWAVTTAQAAHGCTPGQHMCLTDPVAKSTCMDDGWYDEACPHMTHCVLDKDGVPWCKGYLSAADEDHDDAGLANTVRSNPQADHGCKIGTKRCVDHPPAIQYCGDDSWRFEMYCPDYCEVNNWGNPQCVQIGGDTNQTVKREESADLVVPNEIGSDDAACELSCWSDFPGCPSPNRNDCQFYCPRPECRKGCWWCKKSAADAIDDRQARSSRKARSISARRELESQQGQRRNLTQVEEREDQPPNPLDCYGKFYYCLRNLPKDVTDIATWCWTGACWPMQCRTTELCKNHPSETESKRHGEQGLDDKRNDVPQHRCTPECSSSHRNCLQYDTPENCKAKSCTGNCRNCSFCDDSAEV